jgi:hypothetical protein
VATPGDFGTLTTASEGGRQNPLDRPAGAAAGVCMGRNPATDEAKEVLEL